MNSISPHTPQYQTGCRDPYRRDPYNCSWNFLNKIELELVKALEEEEACLSLGPRHQIRAPCRRCASRHGKKYKKYSMSSTLAKRVQVAKNTLRRRRVPPFTQDDLAFPATLPSSDV